MTHEKRYSLCCEALRSAAALLNIDDANGLIKLFEEDPAHAARTPYFPILAALAPIMQEAREGMDKTTTSAGTLAAMKRIANAATREQFRGHWIDKEGRACVCSGSHAVRLLGVKCDSIPAVPVWDGIGQAMQRPASGLYRIELPTAAECKAFRAANGKNKPMPIDGGRRWVDPRFMLDMLQAMPGAVAYTTEKAISPLWFESDQGDGILLPVRPPKQGAA